MEQLMFLHIGKHEIIALESIVLILNAQYQLNNEKNSWLSSGSIQTDNMVEHKIKSIIIMHNGEIFFSHIGSGTLQKRIQKTQKPEGIKYLRIKKLKK